MPVVFGRSITGFGITHARICLSMFSHNFTDGSEPVFYFSFDYLDGVQLMEGAVEINFYPLVDGKINISTNVIGGSLECLMDGCFG